jgi:hypothetical protein
MGGVQFAFLTLPLHSQRRLCIVMLGTGCKFFRIFIVGAVARSYVNLLRLHILQPVPLVSNLPTNLPLHNSLPIDPPKHLPIHPPTYYLPTYVHTYIHSLSHTHTHHTHTHHIDPTSQGSEILTCLSTQFPIQVTVQSQRRSEHEAPLNIHLVLRLRMRRICAVLSRA